MRTSETKIEEMIVHLRESISKNGFPPSYRELASDLDVKSINTIKIMLDKIEERGIIRRQAGKNRTIEFTDKTSKKNEKLLEMPLVGKITAGTPILATENFEETIKVSRSIFNEADGVFMLRVSGDSMIDAGIFDGDFIVVRKQDSAENGDIVAAMFDGCATVKTFYKENGFVRLQPQNNKYTPIIVKNDLSILGKVIGLIRRF
ncbi:MAG: transcriptional repressor LexA [Clostridia bacterium]